MKNSELWKQYEDYTIQLSSIARTLAFGAAGFSWIFKSPNYTFPGAILNALRFTVAFFLADFLQYLFGALILRFWIRHKEKEMYRSHKTIEGDYAKPAWLDYPAYILWCLKIVLLLAAYIFIGVHLFK